jgi:hypothetical protein
MISATECQNPRTPPQSGSPFDGMHNKEFWELPDLLQQFGSDL